MIEEAKEVLIKHTSPIHAIVTSMDSDGGPGRDLVNWTYSTGQPVRFALQDFWGQRMRDRKAWAWSKDMIDHLFVNDDIGKQASLKAWPEFPADNIHTAGYPALDRFKDLAQPTARHDAIKEVDRITNDADGLPLVVWSGQLRRAGEILKVVAQAINKLGDDVPRFKFLARKHPRFDNQKDQHQHWDEALASITNQRCVTNFPTSGDLTMDLLNQAAGIMMSVYSTALVERAALRGPAIAFIDDESQQKIEADTGLEEFPLVTLGCAAKATDADSLAMHMRQIFTGAITNAMTAAQEKHFRVDGGNANRVAKIISDKLLPV
ncbi:MAG: hypothetical protein V4526_02555 [Patescibacteria group bacterium]